MVGAVGSLLLLPRRRLGLPRFLASGWLWLEFFESDVVGLESDRKASDVGSDPATDPFFFWLRLFLFAVFLEFPPSWLFCWALLPGSWETCKYSKVSISSSVST